MPEFVNEAGRRIGAESGSVLARILAKKGYREAGGEESPSVPVADDLAGLKRGELNELADSLGIEGAAKLPNADAVRDAIRDVRSD